MKKYHMINNIIWIHEISWMRRVEARFYVREDVNELKKHFVKAYCQSVQDLVFYKHVPIFFIVVYNILVVMIFLL